MATIADVARAAGVSIATVSRVLSPGHVPHPVRADTAERVRTAARELNFVPSPLARGLAARRSGLIGLLVRDLSDPHYPQIAAGVEERARDADLSVLISNTLGDTARMAEYLQLLEARRVDAVVLSGSATLSPAQLETLHSSAVPLVLIGRPTREVPWPFVSIDNREGARQATRHLADRGRRRIIHLAGPKKQTTMADRTAGYRDVISHLKLTAEVIDSDGTPEEGYRVLQRRLENTRANDSPPDAIFAATDRLAVAAMAVAADRHLHVPRDLAIIGFDDVPLGSSLRPSLSSIAQPAHELGATAIALVQRLAAGELVDPVVLPTQLVARESTLGPGGRYT